MFHSIFNINCIPKWLFKLKKCNYRVQKRAERRSLFLHLTLCSLNNRYVLDKIILQNVRQQHCLYKSLLPLSHKKKSKRKKSENLGQQITHIFLRSLQTEYCSKNGKMDHRLHYWIQQKLEISVMDLLRKNWLLPHGSWI